MASVLCVGVQPAWALQGGEDAATLPVLLSQRSGLRNKLQLSLLVSRTLVSKFTESTGAVLNLQYNFIDQLGLELTGGAFLSGEAPILEEVRANNPQEDPQLSDMHQIQWLAGGSIVWVPVYGRMSFASEWDPSFDLYLLAGGGVVGTRRDVTLIGATAIERSIVPQFHLGGGIRLYMLKNFAFRIDVRNYFYDDPDRGEVPINGNSRSEITGMTSALLGQIGLQFNFGGGG